MRWLPCMMLLLLIWPSGQGQKPPSTATPPSASLVNLTQNTTVMAAIGEIGLQTGVPIGIIPGRNMAALCQAKHTFVLMDLPPESALSTMAQQAHYTLNQDQGVFVLTAPDVTPHQQQVMNFRLREFRSRGRETVQTIGARLSGTLWTEMMHGAGYGGSMLHSVDAPKVSLPRLLKDVTPLDVADRVVKLGPGGLYLSAIDPDRATGPADLTIRFFSYGDPKQLKLDMTCPQ
jgi:hypothetical protein